MIERNVQCRHRRKLPNVRVPGSQRQGVDTSEKVQRYVQRPGVPTVRHKLLLYAFSDIL
jgi:hypothetical protein